MSHKHFQRKTEELEGQLIGSFIEQTELNGSDSKHFNSNTYKVNPKDVPSDSPFKIAEISNEGFIDNDGLLYSFYSLSINCLAELADNIQERES